MDLKKQFETDQKAEERGVWRDVGEGARLKIARKGNPRYRRVFREKTRGMEQQMRLSVIPDDVADQIICEAMAEAILLDWDGIDDAGESIEYSRGAALKFLLKYPDFRDLVDGLSEQIDAYRTDNLASTEKNSGRRSGSSSRTAPTSSGS
jgi:hypothetical protein